MAQLHQSYPGVRVDLIGHSMGGLVARAYVEGPGYTGGVHRLIQCGTPNHGSTWARYRLALEVQEHYRQWKQDPDWHWTWVITDGLGEAGNDLKPGSPFLTKLNARPRRDGVRYTIIAGSQSTVTRIGADWMDCTATWIPRRASHWWGFRHCKNGLERKAAAWRNECGDGDGPVPLKSTELAGVSDYVIVRADHAGLCWGAPPAAWDVIRDRLAK